MVRPFISHSIGPYMVGRGLPVVPPLVCTLVGMDFRRSRTGPLIRPNGGFSCWSFLMSSESNVGSLVMSSMLRMSPARYRRPSSGAGRTRSASRYSSGRGTARSGMRGSGRPTISSACWRIRRVPDSACRALPIDRAVIRWERGDGLLGVDDVHLDLSMRPKFVGRNGSTCAPPMRARSARVRSTICLVGWIIAIKLA